jgi:hypothetical protein
MVGILQAFGVIGPIGRKVGLANPRHSESPPSRVRPLADVLWRIFSIGILICLWIFYSCNSYLSIEKRKYRKGYYVERNLFQHQKGKEKQSISILGESQNTQSRSDSFLHENILTCSATNYEQVKNVITNSSVIPFKEIIFQKDTLKKKKRKDAPTKFDERKDVSKSDNTYNFFAITGSALSIISYAFLAYGLIFDLLIPAIIISFVAFIFCIIGLIQINKKINVKSPIEGLAKFGLIAVSILLGLFLVYVILSYMYTNGFSI